MKKPYFSFLLLCCFFTTYAQLTQGDIAFLGWNTDSPDSYSFITLTDIPGNEQIYFTDRGTKGSDWGTSTEDQWLFTAPTAGISCGTVVTVTDAAIPTIAGAPGATYTWIAGANTNNFNLSAGDQMIAYQSTSGIPSPASSGTFIAAIHGDDGNGTPLCLDSGTGWNLASCVSSVSRSTPPPGLTNGVNCLSLFPEVGTEQDNAKYNGTLIGTSTALRALINDRTNWITDNVTAYDISPSAYSPNVSCVVVPIVLIEFEAEFIADNEVVLSWETASEVNNDYYTLLRSKDRETWTSIVNINGSNLSESTLKYSYTDKSPIQGRSYYKLKQTDLNGQYEYFNTVSVNARSQDYKDLIFYPNPASQVVHISNMSEEEHPAIEVFNMIGENVKIDVSISQYMEGHTSIDVSSLRTGVYFIKIHSSIQRILVSH